MLTKADIDAAMARYEAMTPEQQSAMWQAQRESWVRGFQPCEHGDPDWETCPHCLERIAAKGVNRATD